MATCCAYHSLKISSGYFFFFQKYHCCLHNTKSNSLTGHSRNVHSVVLRRAGYNVSLLPDLYGLLSRSVIPNVLVTCARSSRHDISTCLRCVSGNTTNYLKKKELMKKKKKSNSSMLQNSLLHYYIPLAWKSGANALEISQICFQQ